MSNKLIELQQELQKAHDLIVDSGYSDTDKAKQLLEHIRVELQKMPICELSQYSNDFTVLSLNYSAWENDFGCAFLFDDSFDVSSFSKMIKEIEGWIEYIQDCTDVSFVMQKESIPAHDSIVEPGAIDNRILLYVGAAIFCGLVEITPAPGNLKWKGTKRELAYFASLVSDALGLNKATRDGVRNYVSWKPFQELFNEKGLADTFGKYKEDEPGQTDNMHIIDKIVSKFTK